MKNWLHYTASGLDNVWLANGFVVKETKYGKGYAIFDVDGLHRLLATHLVDKNARLSGQEFRFLRNHLRLTQSSLGKLLGDVSENAVSLWERKDNVPIAYDRWMRMLVLAKFQGNTKVADAMERIQSVERLVHQKYVVRGKDSSRRVDLMKKSEREQLELMLA